MKLLFAAFLGFLLLFGCFVPADNKDVIVPPQSERLLEVNKEPDIPYTYYSSPLFLIYYPSHWSVDDQVTTPGVFRFTGPLQNGEKIPPEFLVNIWAGDESTLEDFEAYEMALLAEGETVLAKKTANYKSKEAFLIEYQGSDQETGSLIYFKTLMFKNGKWVYRLHYAIEVSSKDGYQPIMEDILDKFVIGSG